MGTYEYYKLGENGKEIFKYGGDRYLYFSPSGWFGTPYWVIGNSDTSTAGYIHHPSCKEACPSKCSRKWQFTDGKQWETDTTIKVECVD